MENADKNIIKTDFNMPDTGNDVESEKETDQIYTDKESMVRKQYELYVETNQKEHSDLNYSFFKGGWELCEVYMTQVLRYALANKDTLQKESEE